MEVTLLILLRLAEDIIIGQDASLSQQSCTVMKQALWPNLPSVFNLFTATLSECVNSVNTQVSKI